MLRIKMVIFNPGPFLRLINGICSFGATSHFKIFILLNGSDRLMSDVCCVLYQPQQFYPQFLSPVSKNTVRSVHLNDVALMDSVAA